MALLHSIPLYFFAISLVSVACLLWSVRRAAARGLSRDLTLDVGLAMMVFGFLGGRALHVAYEEPLFYWAHPLKVLDFWQGGFVFDGGAIAAIGAGAAVVRWRGERFAKWADFFSPIGALAYALGRVACWLTGCCYGRVCRLDSGYTFRFPTQLLAVATELLTLAALLAFERRRHARSRPGTEFALWAFLHALGRIAMEAFRDDDRGPQPLHLSLATWISLGLLVGAVGWYLSFSRRKLQARDRP